MLKKSTTKYLILFLSFLFLSVLQPINNANANMFNKFKKGFFFEKYSSANEAQKALLELHPIGSDAGELVKTLERAGCNISLTDQNKLNDAKKNNQKYIKIDKIINCTKSTGLIGWLIWRTSVMLINNSIYDVSISKEYTGL